MSLLVVGSVAYDSVETPAGSRTDALGGSATYFSIAASYFTPIGVVAVVGDDFSSEHVEMLRSHGVDTSGLQRASGKTFRWAGVYGAEDLNTRDTLDTQLNVFAEFSPTLTVEQRKQPYLFLGNIDPELQMDVLRQMETRPTLVGLDTMNFWIDGKNEALKSAVGDVDALFMDEGEARSFAAEANLTRAAKRILGMGPTTVVIKRGEHGVMLFGENSIFAVPAFPLESVVDPTGAGDSFAGGFMGYVAATGDASDEGLRRATVMGSIMGSFAVESFSADRLAALTLGDVQARLSAFMRLSQIAPLDYDIPTPWRETRPVDQRRKPLVGAP